MRYLEITWVEHVSQVNHDYAGETDQAKIQEVREELQAHADQINIVKEIIQKGQCFGFSVCHGAMDFLGKLNWWEDALRHLHDWDGDPAKLDLPILLTDAANRKPTTLRKICELATNYILHTQVNAQKLPGFYVSNMTQMNALRPQTDPTLQLIRLIDDSGNVHTVKQNKCAAGYFSRDQFSCLMDEKTCEKCLCLVLTLNHATRIKYLGNDKWLYYNPNQEIKDSQVHFEGTKNEVLDKIFNGLSAQALTLEVAAFQDDIEIDLSAYANFLNTNPMQLLTKEGVLMMMRSTPEVMAQIFIAAATPQYNQSMRAKFLKLLKEADYGDGKNLLYMWSVHGPNSLPAFFKLADETPLGRKMLAAIAEALVQKHKSANATPLHSMLYWSPYGALALFELAARTPGNNEIITSIGKVLGEKLTTVNMNAIDLMSRYNTSLLLPALFKLANTHAGAASLRVAIVMNLCERVNKELSRLTDVLDHAPAILPEMISLMKHKEGRNLKTIFNGRHEDSVRARAAIAKALCAKMDNQRNVLHVLLRFNNADINAILNLVLMDHDNSKNLDYLLQALAAKEGDKTGWQMLNEKLKPDDQIKLIALLTGRLESMKSDELINFAKDLHLALTDEKSRYRGLCSERHKLFQGYGKTDIWRQLISKSQAILKQRSGVQQDLEVKKILGIKTGP
jgi:hypothetical protein